MTHKDNLIKLRDAVVGGGLVGTRPFAKCFGLQPDNRHLSAWSAYNGDMNAALAFVAEVLPGWLVHDLSQTKTSWYAVLNGEPSPHYAYGNSSTPARALLIAALNALIEMEQDT